MAQGGRQDRRRHRVAARLLRLPGRALDPPQDDEPDRVHVLDGQAAHEGHQGPRLTSRRPGDGVQADRVRRTTLAGSQRTAPRRPRPRRSTLREGEDRRTRTARSRRRRVINEESDPQVLTIPRIHQPYISEGQRTGSFRFGDQSAMALAGSLSLVVHAVTGFTNRSLRGHVAGLLGTDYSTSQMSYDLRRLRLHGLIERRARTNTYTLTPDGIRVAVF